MEIYLLLFSFIIISSLIIFYTGDSKPKRILFLFLSFAAMFLIMGFRTESVGVDTKLYCSIFEQNFTFNLNTALKEGELSLVYNYYNKLISLISTDRRAIIVSNSFLICFLTAIFIYRNSNNVIFSTIFFMTFYHYFSAMNIARQYIAILLVANAFTYLKNKHLFKYILLCLIATLIHNTAIISFLLIPFFFIKPTTKNTFIYSSIIALSFLLLNQIMTLFATIFPHYSMYFTGHYLTDVGENRKVIITAIFIVFALIHSKILKAKKFPNFQERELQLLNLINYLAIIFGILSLKIMLIARIEVYFAIFAIILIPKLLDLLKDRIMYYFIFTLIMIIPMYIQLKGNNSGVIPYQNWLISFFNF